MKKLKRFFVCAVVLAICAATCFCLFGCDDGQSDGGTTEKPGTGTEQPETPAKKKFDGITFESKTVTYNGEEQVIVVSGTMPDGTDVSYENNKATNAGTYSATATLSGDGYETKTLNATLKIEKATFTGITFNDKTVVWTGKQHSVTITTEGDLPSGTAVNYENNTGTSAGDYNAKVTLTNPNYVTLVLNAKLTIKAITAAAKEIVDSLLEKPDPWSFLPEALSEENMAYESSPVLDFSTDFVNVSRIAQKPIGKQMNVLYDGLIDASNLLGYVDTVYAVGNTIAEVYQTYINNNPDDYAAFTGEAGGFRIRIMLDGAKSEILAGNSTVSVELSYDGDSGARTGRIQITSGVALKYESNENSLKFAVRMGAAGVANIKQIEFVRNGAAVAGYMREFTGTDSMNLKTSAAIASDASRTIIMSDKRESDDLKINGYEEVYDSRTGKMLGGEVAETVDMKVKLVDYDTLWFNLYDVSGFTSVKAVKKGGVTEVGKNADDVYINGQSSVFKPKRNKVIIGVETSRHFDVEMKDVWYIVKVDDNGKTKYEKVKTSIPMLFVQKENAKDFSSEVVQENANTFSQTPVLPSASPMTSDFASMQELFETVKDKVTREEIETYIGTPDAFFSAT